MEKRIEIEEKLDSKLGPEAPREPGAQMVLSEQSTVWR